MTFRSKIVVVVGFVLVAVALFQLPAESQNPNSPLLQISNLQARTATLETQVADLVEALDEEVAGRLAEDAALHTAINAIGGVEAVAPFDALAGRLCIRDGSLGTIAIIYADNGDATLRCLLSQNAEAPPPVADFSGSYLLDPSPSYTCASGLIDFFIGGFVLSAQGASLIVTGAPVTMTGVVTGNTFSVQGTIAGAVTESYSLSGTFGPDNMTWSGTFLASFSGLNILDCANQTFAGLTGIRQ